MRTPRWLWLALIGLVCVLGRLSAVSAEVLSVEQQADVKAWLAVDASDRPDVSGLGLPTGLSQEASAESLASLWSLYCETVDDQELNDLPPTIAELQANAQGNRVALSAKAMTLGDQTMPFVVIRKEAGEVGASGRALFICTHGGGQNGRVDGPHAWGVNTREWQTQVSFAASLYQPDGVYFVPRMADDRLGRWWHRHNQEAFERVIEHGVAHWGVDPNRVYLLGISEGGFGTDILAPFMPDRFAGANAMASGVDLGNPPQNLRNLAFRTDVGEKDTMFNRVGLAQKFHEQLDALHEADPAGYTHHLNVQAGKGHGIDYRPGIVWIAEHTRNPWPDMLVWTGKTLHGQRRDRHYWVQVVGEVQADLSIQLNARADRQTNTLTITAHQIEIEGDGGNPTHANAGTIKSSAPLSGVTLRLLLHDDLLDLDRPVVVVVNEEQRFEAKVVRDAAVQLRSLADYGDPTMSASAAIEIELAKQ